MPGFLNGTLKCLQQFVSTEQYAKKVLDKYKHKFAWGKYGEFLVGSAWHACAAFLCGTCAGLQPGDHRLELFKAVCPCWCVHQAHLANAWQRCSNHYCLAQSTDLAHATMQYMLCRTAADLPNAACHDHCTDPPSDTPHLARPLTWYLIITSGWFQPALGWFSGLPDCPYRVESTSSAAEM